MNLIFVLIFCESILSEATSDCVFNPNNVRECPCASRTKTDLDPDLPCGTDDCYWDMGNNSDRCIEAGTDCTNSKDYEKSVEQSLEMDVLLMIDATFSMEPVLNAAKNTVLDLASSLQERFPQVSFRFGSICYRDMVHSSDRHESFDFNPDVTKLRDFLTTVIPIDGDDWPEDIAGGFEIALNLGWRSSSIKAITIIGDAPQIADGHEEGRLLNYLNKLAEMQIRVSVLSIDSGMDVCILLGDEVVCTHEIFLKAFENVSWSVEWESIAATSVGTEYQPKTYSQIEYTLIHSHNHTCRLKTKAAAKGGFWWWWILLIIGLLLLAAIIAAVILFLLYRRRKKPSTELYVPPSSMPVCPVVVMCDGNTKDDPNDHLLRKRQEELKLEESLAAEQRERENIAGRVSPSAGMAPGGWSNPSQGNSAGRFSPGPQNNTGGRFSPGPQNTGGRFSPGPQNNAGRFSPGPGGRFSPGAGFNGQ